MNESSFRTELLLVEPIVDFGFELFKVLAELGVDRWAVGMNSESAGRKKGAWTRVKNSATRSPIWVTS